MLTELIEPTLEDAQILGEICYQAFGQFFARLGLESDFPDVAMAQGLMRMLLARPDVYAIAARVDGKLVGSNFVQLSDPVAGIAPITVSPATQAQGIGRSLMKDVIDYSLHHHGPLVRLVQDATNPTSLSLYTSLGFDVREPLAMVTVPPALSDDPTVRPATPHDLHQLDALCKRIYRVSRRNELAGLIAHGADNSMPVFVRQRQGAIRAYAIPSFLGHGVAETNEDLLATLQVAQSQRSGKMGTAMWSFLCPSRNGDLYRRVLKAGGRTVRCMHLMTMGPYEEPAGPCYPSVAY